MPKAEHFDYVIVGSGSAGGVLAARLSEDAGVRVLLLEAGPDDAGEDAIRIPLAFSTLFKTRWDWRYETEPQAALGGGRAFWPRMKALGGCTSMNAMIYIRGNRLDYDGWRDDHGAEGWGYDDVLPYFVRAEANTRLDAPYHGREGPLHVEDRVFTHPLSHAWVEAAAQDGLARNDDFNGAAQEGAGLYQVTCKDGARWSVADAYLRPAMARPNLAVRTGAFATRVLFDRGRATGVAYRQRGEDAVAEADREVILSAGAINTPQLLMLSGVGPADHLREQGIDVVADLPGVGENLHDHPVVPLLWYTHGTTDVAEGSTLTGLLRWKLTGRGPLASNVAEAGAFFRTPDSLDAPDIQIHAAPTGFWDNGLHEPAARMLTLGPTLVDVHSRGRITLRSADPRWHPRIDPRYLDDGRDLDALLAGTRRTIEIASHRPLAKFLAGAFLPWRGPGIAPVPMGSLTDDDLHAHVRALTQTLYHPVGTCAMGTGPRAVVDPALRVRGVEGLRVADASVMPKVPRGNTNAPTIMVGEKAADLLRAQTPHEAPR